SKNPRYYFDLRRERKNAQKGESSYTPAVALIAALGASLAYIAAQGGGDLAAGRDALIDNAETCAAMTRAAVQALGLELFGPGSYSAAATAIVAPAGVDSGVIVKELKSRFAAIVTNGQGDMKGKIFRIAHIGLFDYMDTIAIIGALEQVAASKLSLPGFAFGKALAAAQQVFADRSKKPATENALEPELVKA
ncbi:MAG TPA: alanine--glyoxylate aminotransferase family protein, partial [Acidobacteriaceae bacterium]|nr:alanine--glyoxylate aminotransferase family protein [Acidobacteriaceae bacterium]